ncbi:bifunctional YncE family protein/alkaline phosphatase family protein [Aureliella helgolandensis]|uniref:Phosphoesterase family protein n=1 Tax=Aureliella helgolandensis TaxID=2527968 RepID=A0A518G1C0_9BACT|nr:bifunctional YncE family protein/alkaline phosphatase family protein [Aureliella helgolandensis]QDV22395.1 Phosphoesterase family protein [Aureliella helgolandensis]
MKPENSTAIPLTLLTWWDVRHVGLVVSLVLWLAGSGRAAPQLESEEPGNVTATPVPGMVGEQASGVLLPTGQLVHPAGELAELKGRPNDLCYSAEVGLVFVKDRAHLHIIDPVQWSILQSLESPGGASLTGIVVSRAGNVYFSNSKQQVHVFVPDGGPAAQNAPADSPGSYVLASSIELPADCFPCGLCLSDDEEQLFVCLSKTNSVAVIDVATSAVEHVVDVGISPFTARFVAGAPGQLFVTNLGGRRARAGERTAPSAGTETPVDERGIANTSMVSVIDLEQMEVVSEVTAELHPTAMAILPGKPQQAATVLITNTNDDSVTLLDSGSLQSRNQLAKPLLDLPFGSMPNSACVSPDGNWLFVGLAGNNAVSVYRLDSERDYATVGLDEPIGYLPTGWFPVALDCSETDLFVANLKGWGSRADMREESKGRNSHDHSGVIQKIPLADILDDALLSQWTAKVLESARVIPVVRAELNAANPAPVVPVPEKLGQPSSFKHVIYVIKENRTYDQVFGDMPAGRGSRALCTFPERVTPNHHALASRFGLLDNYYCNGVLSADGHSWATEGNVTPYLERAFGGFSRSYTFGDDPLTYSSSGFLWDYVLGAGLTFRNYGEMDYAKPPQGMKYQEIWKAHAAGEDLRFEQNIGIERLKRYSSPDYPGWGMMIPDVLRMKRFLTEFEQFKTDGTLPNLSIVYLPQDHLGGGVTSGAHMADNDLALGQLVDAVSHSTFWKNTLIVVNEDDPQNGYDHIDGHRSICLVISAYSRPGVNHHFYNQTSVLRTILHVLGLPPMNQQDARSPLMKECFVNEPNMTPYQVREANIPLNQQPGEESKQSSTERDWRTRLASVPIERTGMKTEQDEDTLNRFVWHEMMGWETPYPAHLSGAHGTGLRKLGLEFDDGSAE